MFMSIYTAYLHSIKISEYIIGIKFDKDPWAVKKNKKNNYLTKIVYIFNIYENLNIFYDLDHWPRNPTNNFKFKSCLFRATNIVKNSDKEKYVYSGYEWPLIVQAGRVLIITLLEML